MSKQNNRRGFTITELVIVIVVIAILAAVLIPTFASLINKANQSADIQAARQMNMALQSASAVEEPETFEEVIDILAEAGYDAEGSLKPITADHQFYWYSTYNVIVLANEEDAENPVVVYPTDNKDVTDNFAGDYGKTGAEQVLFDLETGFYSFVEIEVAEPEAVIAALEKGQSVTLKEDVTVNKEITIPAGKVTTINLNGKTLSTTKTGDRSGYGFNVYGELTLENGTINARGVQTKAEGAKLTIKEGVTINAMDSNGGACVWNEKGEVVIEGGTFNVVGAPISELQGATVVYNNYGTLTINGGTFNSNAGEGPYAIQNKGGTLVINDGTVTTKRGAVCTVEGGTTTINGGKFTSTWSGGSAYVMNAQGNSTLNLKGGTIVANNISHVLWIDEGCTFNNSSSIVLEPDGEYYDFK